MEISINSDGRAETETISLDYQAAHLRPLSPVHIKAENTGSDVHITWIRRTRTGSDDWASLDVPLGEESEAYEVDFLDGATVLATKATTTSNLQIPISELETLYGTPLGNITVSITQMSQTFGRGAPQDIEIML